MTTKRDRDNTDGLPLLAHTVVTVEQLPDFEEQPCELEHSCAELHRTTCQQHMNGTSLSGWSGYSSKHGPAGVEEAWHRHSPQLLDQEEETRLDDCCCMLPLLVDRASESHPERPLKRPIPWLNRNTVKVQIFVRYLFSYFWLETGSYALIFVLSRVCEENDVEIQWLQSKKKFSYNIKFRTFSKVRNVRK